MIAIACTVSGTPTDTPSIVVDTFDTTPYVGIFVSPSRVRFDLPDSVPPWGAWYLFGGKKWRFSYLIGGDRWVEHIPSAPGAYEGPVLEYAASLPAIRIVGIGRAHV